MGSQKIYASVKSYSMRGRLLARSEMQTLAESRDLEELITRIKNTAYADAVSGLQSPYTTEGIESALRGHLAEVHHSIRRTVGNSKMLDAYYMRFLVWNLKIILKGKALGRTQEDIEPHVNLRAEELIKQRDIIVKALVAKDVEEAAATLSSIRGGGEISKAVAMYNEKKNIQAFDIYFDKILYQELGRARKNERNRDVLKLVERDIDFYNLMSTIRGKFWGLDESQIGDLTVSHTAGAPRDLLEKMAAAAGIREAFSELASTRYRDLVPQAESEMDAVSEFERSFEMTIYKAANSAFTKMFSPATILGITKLTAYEVRNMGAVAYAVEQGIPTEIVMSKLILAE